MANQQTTSNAPWRKGRPSFKGFRIEFFLLILFTLVCLICAFVWSYSIVKQSREDSRSEQPASTSFYAPSSVAFAQDASIDESVTSTSEASEEVAEPTQNVETSAVDVVTNGATDKIAGMKLWVKILFVWIACLIFPLVLWIWRGWIWFSTIFGIKYELRSDADNLKATTFLITRGIFEKCTDSMHIGQIDDVKSTQTMIQKYLLGGIGNVILHTRDVTDPIVKMKNLDEPSRVFNAFDELRRYYWAHGGFHVSHEGAAHDGDQDGAHDGEHDVVHDDHDDHDFNV